MLSVNPEPAASPVRTHAGPQRPVIATIDSQTSGAGTAATDATTGATRAAAQPATTRSVARTGTAAALSAGGGEAIGSRLSLVA